MPRVGWVWKGGRGTRVVDAGKEGTELPQTLSPQEGTMTIRASQEGPRLSSQEG